MALLNPLYVDLDGTLIRGDVSLLLWKKEFRIRPIRALWILGISLYDRAFAKSLLKEKLDPLSYNRAVLEILYEHKRAGQRIVLATGAFECVAHEIANDLGCFDAVIATTSTYNCVGVKKRRKIVEDCPTGVFSYIGDSRKDIPIFNVCKKAYVVGNMIYEGPHVVRLLSHEEDF